ncbi:MAG: hypothetical protein WCC99_01790 [Candidatus Sulfotelmatobacter sp.]
MASITLFASPVAMATTQLARVIRYEVSAPGQAAPAPERQPLRMNWVVVTDKDGSRRLRMQWATSGNC